MIQSTDLKKKHICRKNFILSCVSCGYYVIEIDQSLTFIGKIDSYNKMLLMAK